jgi:hypothetical protein
MVLGAAQILLSIVGLYLVRQEMAGRMISQNEAHAFEAIENVVGLLQLLVYVGTIVTFLIWFLV